MYCPICGQQQVSEDTRFCSRCGFLLTGVSHLITNDGRLSASQEQKIDTPRKKGIKKGAFIFLMSFLIVPLIAIFSIAVNIEPFLVAIAAIILTVGGLLRVAYAFMFESNAGADFDSNQLEGRSASRLRSPADLKNLPPASIPATDYTAPRAGNWRDTNDLQPSSVIEHTTRQLRSDEEV